MQLHDKMRIVSAQADRTIKLERLRGQSALPDELSVRLHAQSLALDVELGCERIAERRSEGGVRGRVGLRPAYDLARAHDHLAVV